MAENVVQCDDDFVHSIKTLLWGNNIKKDVFKRWAQGKFIFFFFFYNEIHIIYIKLLNIIKYCNKIL